LINTPVRTSRLDRVARGGWCVFAAIAMLACGSGASMDAGEDEPRGLLPVDARNPIVLFNDGPYDNWQGEYAILFAGTGVVNLAGIVVNASPAGKILDENMVGWQGMVTAARQSGLSGIPDPLASDSTELVRPTDGQIESTVANGSEGAQFIIDTSKRLALPFRPLVVVSAGRLTDLADAYLLDPTVTDRVVVVASLGTTTTAGAEMGMPNGEMDEWADVIVASKFRYIQISAFYDQMQDAPTSLFPQLPSNAFTSWIEAKQSSIFDDIYAADQVSILALAEPAFVASVDRVDVVDRGPDDLPLLSTAPTGANWLVTSVSGALATASFWQMLLEPKTFRP